MRQPTISEHQQVLKNAGLIRTAHLAWVPFARSGFG
jgi:hypothetical protein